MSFTFYRASNDILFNYEIKSIILTRPYFIKDLGVILDRKLSFHDHIDAIISKIYGDAWIFKKKFI